MRKWWVVFAVAVTALGAAPCLAVEFQSPLAGAAITGQLIIPPTPAYGADGGCPVVVYLKNLSIPRLGQEPDQPIIHDLLEQGFLVLVLDYAHNPRATSPAINADMLEIRQEIGGKTKKLLTDYKIDLSRIYFLIEGFRLKRDVEFARDGARVLAMDIAYPSRPVHPVPALMEITCDNAHRMGTFSLLFCHDTLYDGGMAAGFAVAMIDHPVAPPYKGIDDPMPECIYRLKAAVRTLRFLCPQLHLTGRIGAIGFSRGGPMAALLAVTGGRADLEGPGSHPEISSSVQAALIHGCRYDFEHLDDNDSMLKRFEKAWGPLADNRERWAAHGAAHYLTSSAAPMFLDTSDAESAEYRDQLALFDRELTAAGVPHRYQVDADRRGHRVTTDPKTLAAIYGFFHDHLDIP